MMSLSNLIYWKRTRRSRGTGWQIKGIKNNILIWVFDWLIGWAEFLDGILTIASMGFLGGGLAYHCVIYKLKFMSPKEADHAK